MLVHQGMSKEVNNSRTAFTIKKLPEGDYVIHAYIEEARNLLADAEYVSY
jgi:hypothetical protein